MNKGFDLGLALIWVAGIFVLVRPRSQGPSLVKTVGDSLVGLLGKATGGGTF